MFLWDAYFRLAPLESNAELVGVWSDSSTDLIEVERTKKLLSRLSGRCAVLEFHLGEIGLGFDIYAPDVETAASQGKILVDEALHDADLPPMRIVKLELIDKDAPKQASDSEPPPLMGVAELAKFLGVRKQRITQLRRTRAFPVPVEELSMGPVWLRSHIVEWHERRKELT